MTSSCKRQVCHPHLRWIAQRIGLQFDRQILTRRRSDDGVHGAGQCRNAVRRPCASPNRSRLSAVAPASSVERDVQARRCRTFEAVAFLTTPSCGTAPRAAGLRRDARRINQSPSGFGRKSLAAWVPALVTNPCPPRCYGDKGDRRQPTTGVRQLRHLGRGQSESKVMPNFGEASRRRSISSDVGGPTTSSG